MDTMSGRGQMYNRRQSSLNWLTSIALLTYLSCTNCSVLAYPNGHKSQVSESQMKKVRQWIEVELFQNERQNWTAKMQRAGILRLQLHSSFKNHELTVEDGGLPHTTECG